MAASHTTIVVENQTSNNLGLRNIKNHFTWNNRWVSSYGTQKELSSKDSSPPLSIGNFLAESETVIAGKESIIKMGKFFWKTINK